MFANKQDLPNAMPASELTKKLGLNDMRSRTVRMARAPTRRRHAGALL